ncbi:MAG: 1,6-anhydro-N-acetylmuramyl-L-alanine amidase AmpD [Gammaproteobacteria bacterium]
MDIQTGRIAEARQVPSPNCDERPANCVPDLIVIHGISLPPGEFGGPWIDALFCNELDPDAHPYFEEIADHTVSSHLLIRRDGELIQYVSLNARAWHAGESCHEGRERCNDFSIGIELEGTDELPYTAEQYTCLGAVVRSIRGAYPKLREVPLVGHSDIAPGRKTDPGPAFDWENLTALLRDAS